MQAYFDAAGKCLCVASGFGELPGTAYVAAVPDTANPNLIFWDTDDGMVKHKSPFAVTVEKGRIVDVPRGTFAVVNGEGYTVDDGIVELSGVTLDVESVTLDHPRHMRQTFEVEV